MILIDANLLLYAYDTSSPRHEKARQWFEGVMSDEPDIRFGLMTLLAFVRLVTDQRVFDRPLETARAVEIVESWLARANVSVAHPSERHWAALAARATTAKVRVRWSWMLTSPPSPSSTARVSRPRTATSRAFPACASRTRSPEQVVNWRSSNL